jgi:hypothetical protein
MAESEAPAQEGGGVAELPVGLKPLKVQHDRDAMATHAVPGGGHGFLGMGGGIDHQMAEAVGERGEVALRVDHGLLHPGGGLLHQPAQEVGLAAARISLNQEAGREKLLQVHHSASARIGAP